MKSERVQLVCEEPDKPTTFFQASKELTIETKIKRTIDRLKKVGRDVKTLYYATSHAVPSFDQLEFQFVNPQRVKPSGIWY
jgi:hypothetical protein